MIFNYIFFTTNTFNIKMFIKKLDYLSPPITFYHQGLLFHSSFVSGIISIISILIIIIFTVYYSLELIKIKIQNLLHIILLLKIQEYFL